MEQPAIEERAARPNVPSPADTETLTASEVARRERVSVEIVCRAIRSGRLPAQWDGRAYRVSEHELEKWRAVRRTSSVQRRLKPRNALQDRLLEHVKSNSTSVAAVAREIGCTPGALHAWYAGEGRALSEAIMRALAALLDVSFEIAKAEAGGLTADEKIADIARANLTKAPQPGTDEFAAARKKAGETMRGRERPPEVRAKIAEGNRRAGSGERGAGVLDTWRRDNDEAPIAQQLWKWLSWHPHPRRREVLAYAGTVASRLGCEVGDVLGVWVPHLQRRGAWSQRGRPAKDDVRQELRRILALIIDEFDELPKLNELEAQVGLVFWQSGAWTDIAASAGDPESYDRSSRKHVVRRVDGLIGDDCRKALQMATPKFASALAA